MNIMGLITTVSPYRGSLSPQPKYYPTPSIHTSIHTTSISRQHHIFLNPKSNSSLDFNCSIDNTGLSVIGNIIDATVSDERLKKNIEDVDANCLDCAKKVGIKSFEYKDEKYRSNDTFGFIAQELLENLPDEFKNIVRENKEKDSDAKYLSINYMKLTVLLWGCNQKLIEKIEHLEASVYELQEAMKDI